MFRAFLNFLRKKKYLLCTSPHPTKKYLQNHLINFTRAYGPHSIFHDSCIDVWIVIPSFKQAFYNKSPCRRSSHLNLMQNLELPPHEQIQFCYITARTHRLLVYLKQVSTDYFLLKNFLVHSLVVLLFLVFLPM